jgi:hypothetical protein
MTPEIPGINENSYYDTTWISEQFDTQMMMDIVLKVTSAPKILSDSSSPDAERHLDQHLSSYAPQGIIIVLMRNNFDLSSGLLQHGGKTRQD